VTLRRVPLTREIAPARDAQALVAVRRLLAYERPAILHTHMAKAGTVGRLAALSMRGRAAPLTVHTFHGHVLEGYFGQGAQRAILETERRLARRTDRIIAVSPQIRDQLVDLGIGRNRQIDVVPLGLDLHDFLDIDGPTGQLRAKLGVPRDAPLVGIVGRLVPIKDVSTALAAIERIPGVHLAVVGDGDERPALEAEARTRGIADRTHFTGWSDDIPGVMADLDVAILSSRNEGTPVSLIEALAAGRPVVATDVGGVAFVVEDGRSGYVVPPGDASALAERTDRLLANPDERAAMGRRGREYVRARFGSERLVDDIRALYDEMLGAREPAPHG
jgi:glycosyltransferase involved in cell wall biosynthesis